MKSAKGMFFIKKNHFCKVLFTFKIIDETLEISISSEVQVVYTDCQQALSNGQRTSGVYIIDKEGLFNVYCDMVENTTGYIVSAS